MNHANDVSWIGCGRGSSAKDACSSHDGNDFGSIGSGGNTSNFGLELTFKSFSDFVDGIAFAVIRACLFEE